MEVPRVGNKLVETKYDVCASRVFSSVSSNIELWVVFPLTFDYRKLSSWLSNTPTSEKTEKWVSLSLSVWSNILQRWNRRAEAWSIGHMLHVWAIYFFETLADWQLPQVQPLNSKRLATVQILFTVHMARGKMIYFIHSILSSTDTDCITLLSFSTSPCEQ